MARIKTQHRIRQSIHKPRFYKRRSGFVKQSRKDNISLFRFKSTDQRKCHCQQDPIEDLRFKSIGKYSCKGKRIKGQHDNKTGRTIRNINCRKPSELPQTVRHSKRIHSVYIRNSTNLQVA